MSKNIATLLALGGLLLGIAACDGDDKSGAKSSPTAPASAPTSGTTAPTASATPSDGAPATSAAPRATPTKPEITNSKQIVLIDPDGKRYTFTTMLQMAAGMRATMGENAPPNFCATSYQQGVAEGGKFPAGREAFMAACQEGWRKGARP